MQRPNRHTLLHLARGTQHCSRSQGISAVHVMLLMALDMLRPLAMRTTNHLPCALCFQ